MMKLVTAEVVFSALKGEIKLATVPHQRCAWRKAAPLRAARRCLTIHSKVRSASLLHSAVIQSVTNACIARGRHGRQYRAYLCRGLREAKRARERLTKSTFANSNGLPDPGNKMTVRELLEARAPSSRPIRTCTNCLARRNSPGIRSGNRTAIRF